jgi:hypothetical protein
MGPQGTDQRSLPDVRRQRIHLDYGARRMKRCYLAGPMRGIPEYNFPAFYAAAASLRERGIEVWSPAENDVHADGFDPAKDTAQPMRHYMKRDLPAVLDADFVAVLPGWERSQGAQLEVHVARTCGIPVLDAATLEPAAAQGAMCSMGGYCDQAPPCSSPEKCAKRVASEREASGKPYHIYEHLKYTDAIVDAPRQLLAYAETPGRTMQGARKHLEQCGIEYRHCWPDWAYESGHLTKGGLAELVHRMMEAERYVAR